MNPATASMPAAPRQIVNDVAAPQAPPAAPNSSMPSAPSIVNNIPVHNQEVAALPANEDAELDMIMHQVGQEIKKEDKKPLKHGFLNFGHKSKPASAFDAPRPAALMPAPSPAAVAPALPASPAVLTQTPPAAAKPKPARSIPAFAIFVALLVTGFLTAAAIAAYRQT